MVMEDKERNLENSPQNKIDRSRIGKLTPEEIDSLIPEASPDDPIYTRGLQIGGFVSTNSLPGTKPWDAMSESEQDREAKLLFEEGLERLFAEMEESVPRQFGKAPSNSPTGPAAEGPERATVSRGKERNGHE